jgi:hypothetical protein
VIVYVPFGVRRVVATVSVDDGLDPGVTPVGLKLMVTPVADGEMLDVRFTNPVKPFTAVTVTVYVVDDPREVVRADGVTAKLKSCGGGAVGLADTSFDRAPVPAMLIAATL